AGWREEFEGMRILYVAATRAEDRLIFSGAIERKKLEKLADKKAGQWLSWLWQALELNEHSQSEVKEVAKGVQIDVRIDRGLRREPVSIDTTTSHEPSEEQIDVTRPFTELFPLLQPITPECGEALRRFSVTQLINFQRCARQYYFDRMLHAPGREELAAWNDA